jgi:Fur family ferric uptake transcriptional regulator
MTTQRKIILEELKNVTTHPTADELYRIVKKRLPKISLGTIYRNLEVLSESGLIQKIEVPGTTKRFDGTTDDHHHLRCVSCGAVRDVDLGRAVSLPDIPDSVDGCRIIACRLDLIGLCPQCQK